MLSRINHLLSQHRSVYWWSSIHGWERGRCWEIGWAILIIIRGLRQDGLTFFECPPPLGSFTHCQAQDKGHYEKVNVNTHTHTHIIYYTHSVK
jgi:hypothetical protein